MRLIDIADERFWQILFDEACIEGQQAERIEKELEKLIDEQPKVGECEIDCKNCWKFELIKPRWIPCSERLPDKEDTYLVAWLPAYTDEKGETFTLPCSYTHYYMLAEYVEEEWEFRLPNGYIDAILLAWQPLPEPYKENADD